MRRFTARRSWVIIGFNEQVAWGVTNVGSDVLDFYSIRFRDAFQSEYWLDSAWAPARQRIEIILVRGAGAVRDTIPYTRNGPIVYETGDTSLNSSVPVVYPAKCISHPGGLEELTYSVVTRSEGAV